MAAMIVARLRALCCATDRLDVMAVRIAYEAAEIVGPVFREELFVQNLGAESDRRVVELKDDRAVGCRESKAQFAVDSSCRGQDPEGSVFPVSETNRVSAGVHGAQSEWCEPRLVERSAAGDVSHLQGEMVDHARTDCAHELERTVAWRGLLFKYASCYLRVKLDVQVCTCEITNAEDDNEQGRH
jgi:hypothetical protein